MRVSLEPPPGLVSDDTTFSAEGRYETGSNIRFKDGKAQTIGPWQTAINTALTGLCRNVLAWTTVSAGVTYAFGTHSALMAYASGTLADITPSGLSTGSIDSAGSAPGWGSGTWGTGTWSTPNSLFYVRTWSFDTWGETLVAVPRGGTLYQWENDLTADAVAIANAPDEITAMLVTPERQVLAFGCNEELSTDFNPLCIRGCDLEDLTNWTTADDNNAFEHILEGGGQIVTARMVGPYVAVWTDNSVYLGQYLGDPGQTYRFTRVETNCGLIGPNAVHIYKGIAYWVDTAKQFRVWQPGLKPATLPCQIHSDFADNLDLSQGAKIVASGVSSFDEIWFFYPDLRDAADNASAENSRYVMVNVGGEEALWSRGLMERTAFVDAGVVGYPVGVDPDGMVYHHEIGSADVDWSIETADQYIEEADRFYELQNLRPDFEAQGGDVTFTVTTRKTPQGDALATKGPYTLSVGQEKHDFRASGRIVRMTFSGSQFTRFGKSTLEAVSKGNK